MPWALTEIEPPTVKMSVDCIARTAKRGWMAFWMSCQVAPAPTFTVRRSGSSAIAFRPRMSSTIPFRAKACPPMLCFTPAAETVSPRARA